MAVRSQVLQWPLGEVLTPLCACCAEGGRRSRDLPRRPAACTASRLRLFRSSGTLFFLSRSKRLSHSVINVLYLLRSSLKVVKAAAQVLNTLWQYRDLRSIYKKVS